MSSTKSKGAKSEGTIASVFASLSGDGELGFSLPQRFADMKSSWISGPEHAEKLTQAWRSVLAELKKQTEQVAGNQEACIPQIEYPGGELGRKPLAEWVPKEQLEAVKYRGVAVIKGVVPEELALDWKARCQEYSQANPSMKGFPADNKQVFEMYWSKPQIEARGNPDFLNVSKSFLQLFKPPSQDPSTSAFNTSRAISLNNPIVYADRMRIRLPGDAKFALGPHIDGGGVERWEDEAFRTFYKRILRGECNWRQHDPWSLGVEGERLMANGSLYEGAGQCSVFRPFQGWLSLSHTKRNEGTLRVLPLLHEATAYIMLRPFFKPKQKEKPVSASSPHYSEGFLDADNWVFDPTTPDFPGCSLGHNIELNAVTHPHLHLDSTMTSIPKVAPGDVVFWHTDLVHAVEAKHQGRGDSSVLYIPAIPLTKNAFEYLVQQRHDFQHGLPPSDFPGGEGEKSFVGRAGEEDVRRLGEMAARAMGFEKFDETAARDDLERALLRECNARL